MKKRAISEIKNHKPIAVQVRGNPAWKLWVEDLAEAEGDTVAKLVERSLRLLAKNIGHPGPPMR